MSIADNIKQLRISRGLSQKEFAVIAGVTDKAVSTWEASGKIPRMGAIQRIADYFNIKKSAIIEDNLPMPEPAPAVLLTEAEREHLEQYRQLTEENKNTVDDFISYHLSRQNEQLKKESISG